jgi:hypothetical protein
MTRYEIKGSKANCAVFQKTPSGAWKAVFYGNRTECKEWIERNGHDDWN